MAFTLMGLLILTSCRDRSADEANSKLANSKLIMVPTTNSPPSAAIIPSSSAETDKPDQKFEDIVNLERQGNYVTALEKANAAVAAEPKNVSAYIVRGHIYSEMNLLVKAASDYQTILQLDPDNFSAKFNASEVKLMQKDYDNARSGFLALENHPDWGDLAAYKVFVCDLFGGHEDVAKSELDAFDNAGSNASYYYSKATWEFYHNQPEAAQPWLDSATRIYPPKKIYFYSATLVDFGYLKQPSSEAQVH